MNDVIKESYERLLSSSEFKNEGVLCSFFLNCELGVEDSSPWQIDFYNKDSDTITSYIVGDSISVSDNSKIFKKDSSPLEKLSLSDVKFDFSACLKKSHSLLKNINESVRRDFEVFQ